MVTCHHMIVGMIGAIKSGCGYVPIDTSVPKERVNMIIDKVQPEIILILQMRL